jgi:hypothetical protein
LRSDACPFILEVVKAMTIDLIPWRVVKSLAHQSSFKRMSVSNPKKQDSAGITWKGKNTIIYCAVEGVGTEKITSGEGHECFLESLHK